jgi:N-acetylmuramoyl-L-alanine amidase
MTRSNAFIPRFLLVMALGLLVWAAPIEGSLELKPASATTGRWQGGAYPDTVFEGVRYVSTVFLETLFGREGSWVPDRQKYVVQDSAGRKWTFTLDNPYMNIGDEVLNLGFPVRRGPDLLYLPLPSLLRILNGRMGYDIAPPQEGAPNLAAARPVSVPPKPVKPDPSGFNILELDTEDRENGTLVSVRTAGRLNMESYWVPPHFILKFEKGLLAPQFPTRAAGQGLVRQIHSVQEKDLAQVTLNITRAIDTVEVAYSDNEDSPRYLVTVRKKNSRKEAAEAPKPAATAGGKGTIIIDPGHGGKDPGAQVGGVSEAQVTLAVGLLLKEKLTKLGYKALLTREKDEYVSLDERPKFASNKGGDLFVSLHCNSIGGSPKRKNVVSGHVAYILREGESEEDKALARRENQAISEESGKGDKKEISPVEWILLEHQLNLYSKESEAFAERVIEEFDGFSIGKYGTGAGQAGFYVLVGAYMPAILFEMGFLTHDKDRRMLASDKGQAQIADRMAQAIHKYMAGRKAPKEGRGKE